MTITTHYKEVIVTSTTVTVSIADGQEAIATISELSDTGDSELN